MFNKTPQYIPLLSLLLGLVCFIYVIINHTFSHGIIVTIFFLYVWIFSSIYVKQFQKEQLVYILSITGMMLAATHFFMYGIEELPYPEGAILFHSEQIAKSTLVFFISSIVFLQRSFFELQVKNKTAPKTQNNNESQWEQATMEDLESGNFEPI